MSTLKHQSRFTAALAWSVKAGALPQIHGPGSGQCSSEICPECQGSWGGRRLLTIPNQTRGLQQEVASSIALSDATVAFLKWIRG